MKHLFCLPRSLCVLSIVAILGISSPELRADVIAADDASNYSGFSGSENLGSGFGSWVKQTDNNADTFLQVGTGNANSIGTGGSSQSWGLSANGGSTDNVVAYRPFSSNLAVGNSFTIKMDNDSVAGAGSVGFTLKSNNTSASTGDYNNGSRFEFLFLGGESNYSYIDSTGRPATGVGVTSSGLTLTLVITGTNTFNLYVNDAANTSNLDSQTGRTLIGSGAISSLAIYDRNADNHDQFFNSISVYNPEYTGGAGNWSTAGNWQNSNKVLDGNNLIFSGAGGAAVNDLSNANANFGNVQQVNNLSFKSGAGAYTLSGNALNVNGGITNSSSNLQRVNFGMTLGAAQTFAGGASGLAVGGTVNNNGNLLTTTGTDSFSAAISGSGGLTVSSGTTTLTGANTYSGGTSVTGGILQIGVDTLSGATIISSAVGTGSLTLGDGTTLRSDGATARTLRNNIGLSGNITLGATTTQTGDLTFDYGALTNQSAITLLGDTQLTTNVATTINNGISGSGINLTKGGDADLVLGAANTFSGSYTANGGYTVPYVNDALGSISSLVINNGAIVYAGQTDLTNIINDSAALTLNGTGQLDVSGGTETVGSLSSASSTSTVIIGDFGSHEGSFTVGDGNSTAFAGVISGSRSTEGSIFTKQGAGTLTLTNENTYTGLTTITAGTLAEGVDDALSTGGVTVNGATAAFNIGTHSDSVGAVTLTDGSITGTSGTLTGTSYGVENGTISAKLGGSGALNKTTSGTVVLTSASTGFTGVTSVSAGTLVVNGSIANSAVLVSGGTLSGTGTVGALTVSSGTLAPGTSPGILHVDGDVSLALGSTFLVDINGAVVAGTDYDQLAVVGGVSLAGTLTLNSSYTGMTGDSLIIIDNDGADAVNGTFSGLVEGASIGGFTVSYIGGDGNDVVLNGTAVPEPSTWLVGAMAAAVIGYQWLGVRRRRFAKVAA